MDQDWDRIDELFWAAAGLPSGSRDAYLDLACAGDEALRAQLSSLVLHDSEAHPLISAAVGSMAFSLFESDVRLEGTPRFEIGRRLGSGGS